MAGIGFDLRKMVSRNADLLSKIRGYASAGLISAGPWIITMIGLSLVGLTYSGNEQEGSTEPFLAIMTYVFSFSLLTVSGLQMAFTRWLADALYTNSYEAVAPAFVVALWVVAGIQAPIAITFCSYAGFTPELTTMVTALYVIVSMTWIALVWLSVIRQYERILIAFLIGIGVFWISLHAFRPAGGLVGAVGAYTLGSGATLVLMVGLILRGTEPGTNGGGGDVLKSLRRYPALVLIGAIYGLGIWADKFVFWFTAGIESHPMVWSHPLYDSCFFLAYLTVVPALTINLVHLETSFYERYRAYFAAILGGFPLGEIEIRCAAMTRELRRGAMKLIRTQGAITLACMIMAGSIVRMLDMPTISERVLRFALLGAFFQVLFLITVLVQLYFDLRREALFSSTVFFVANLCLATWSIEAGVGTYGAGYTMASLLALIISVALLDRALSKLTYRTFTTHAHPS